MEKEFVNYNQALRLKALGFDEPCMLFFSKELNMSIWLGLDERSVIINKEKEDEDFLIPTFSQAFRWFREKYDMHYQLIPFYSDKEGPAVDYYFAQAHQLPPVKFKTYEEAELACLDKLIEIVEIKVLKYKSE